MKYNVEIFTSIDDDSLVGELVEMDSSEFPWPWTKQAWLSFLSSSRSFSLAILRDNSKVIGFSLFEVFKEDKMAHLYKIAVNTELRGRGAAFVLFKNHLDSLKSSMVDSIYLEVALSNTVAIKFYERQGLETVHQKKKFYQNGEDALVMTGRI